MILTAESLDLVMPDLEGLETLKRVESLDANCEVIIITGYGSIETAVKSVKLGAFDYIQKPLNFNNILKKFPNDHIFCICISNSIISNYC